jgi:hypothetical protein
VREYWSVENKDIDPLGITPPLQYSITPELMKFKNPHDELPSFGQ